MKYLILLAVAFSFQPAFGANGPWKDCNLPQWKQTCEAEFVQKEIDRKAAQNLLSGAELNKYICESIFSGTCTGGAGGVGGGGA